jgi:hypothetical protein
MTETQMTKIQMTEFNAIRRMHVMNQITTLLVLCLGVANVALAIETLARL